MEKKILLKDFLFNQEKVTKIAAEIKESYSDFNSKRFIKKTVDEFPKLELKERINWISENLKTFLPQDFTNATNILLKSLPPPNNPNLNDNDFGDFIYAPYSDFVSKNGCNEKYLEFSLNALKEITKRFSAEDAIRYFINTFPDKTLETLENWTNDPHYHVRRLASEGTRPKLPWSQKIKISVKQSLPILDKLYYDRTRFVTRSVANHINDISKIDSNLTIKTLTRWRNSKKQSSKEMNYIINHSLRSLVKLGNKDALEFLGFSPTPKIKISKLEIQTRKVKIGTTLEFDLELISEKDEKLIIDYLIYFQNRFGEMKNKKVFKITQILMKKNQKFCISKKHPLRKMTTRKLFPGKHKLEIQINGAKLGNEYFDLAI
ncbi:MAG: DNA alkylation repair protein [Leptospiraceae bacterium]|nr:hypothetical protein [Leptospiraceae bacterium]MCP5494671.1 DNA alkylation repair protein [Leptospiraceae bacterium]